MSLSFANKAEAREISKMANEIWHEYFKSIIGQEQTEYMLMRFQTERKILEQMDSGYQYGFIFDGDRKIGYFAVHPEGDSLFISKIYIYKDERGKGLGSEAIEDILDLGKSLGMRRAYLTVNVNNALACKAYERNGFTIEKDVKKDIGDGFIMDDHIYEYKY